MADKEMDRIGKMLPLVNSTDKAALQVQMRAAQARGSEIDGQLSRLVKKGSDAGLSDVGGQTPPGTPTATNPKTGEKLILKGGKWVPLQ